MAIQPGEENMLTSVRGVYRNGKVELEKPPRNVKNESPVIVTFLDAGKIDLRMNGIDKSQARKLQAQLSTFAEDWNSPEMDAYDNYDAGRAKT
jgi:hypothetical protein